MSRFLKTVMGIGKILGISLGVVSTLGAIGGITAVVVTRQNNAVVQTTNEEKTDKETDKKETNLVTETKRNETKQTQADEAKVESKKEKETEKRTEKGFPECKGAKGNGHCGVL